MSTRAYECLSAKLNILGREYFEGFSVADFAGLTSEELAEAIDVFKIRARQRDGVSLDALKRILPSEDFLRFAEEVLLDIKGTEVFVAQLVTAIFEISPNNFTWGRLLSVLRTSNLQGRRWILNRVSPDQVSEEWRFELARVLARLILKEPDPSLLLSESVSLLLARGFTPKSDLIAEYAKRLQDADKQNRKIALTELGVMS